MAGPSHRDNVNDTAGPAAGQQETERLKTIYRDTKEVWRHHMRLVADAEGNMAEIML